MEYIKVKPPRRLLRHSNLRDQLIDIAEPVQL